jgi:hypothetical protein
MTLPTLIHKINMVHFKSKLKEDYSILSQAHQQIAEEFGGFQYALNTCSTYTGDQRCMICMQNIFKDKLKVLENCTEPQRGKCFTDPARITFLNGEKSTNPGGEFLNSYNYGIILANGSSMQFYLDTPDCTYGTNAVEYPRCGWTTIDVNGSNNPNKFGEDIYLFMINSDTIRPAITGSTLEMPNGDCTNGRGYSCSGDYLMNK